MDFRKLFGLGAEKRQPELGVLFDALSELLSGLEDDEVLRVTGLAGLLGKVAYSDKDISSEELAAIKQILTEHTPISPSLFDRLLKLLEQHTTELSGLEDHRYNQMLNDTLERNEKLKVLDFLYAVAASSGSVSYVEDQSINLIAKGLRLTHEDYVNSRRPYLDRLEILRG